MFLGSYSHVVNVTRKLVYVELRSPIFSHAFFIHPTPPRTHTPTHSAKKSIFGCALENASVVVTMWHRLETSHLYSLRDFWRRFCLSKAAAHSDCCFLRRVRIFLLTYLLTRSLTHLKAKPWRERSTKASRGGYGAVWGESVSLCPSDCKGVIAWRYQGVVWSDGWLGKQPPRFGGVSYPHWLRGTVLNVGLWPVNFPCPTLDLRLMGDHLCG